MRCVKKTQEEKTAFQTVINEIIVGVMHSMLVAFDGGAELNEHYVPMIVDSETGAVPCGMEANGRIVKIHI
ncbi:hypothetical protein [Aneurinibacillus tyrosinisolvens]|uniref:hypothetical protein n=1 Tax=Aneurinibacillus tyrosinisolvens TaxID=1443435 RepID=UPI00063FBB30|nr:hypothetical protein [Aneurinibacillus tyrosinisolvens]